MGPQRRQTLPVLRKRQRRPRPATGSSESTMQAQRKISGVLTPSAISNGTAANGLTDRPPSLSPTKAGSAAVSTNPTLSMPTACGRYGTSRALTRTTTLFSALPRVLMDVPFGAIIRSSSHPKKKSSISAFGRTKLATKLFFKSMAWQYTRT